MKQCTHCKEWKDDSEFYIKSNGYGLRSWCKKCHTEVKDIPCQVCGKVHTRHKLNRRSSICGDCYPLYRQAYNLHGAAKHRASKDELPFNLEILDILNQLKQPCPMTNFDFVLNKTGQNIGNINP